MGQIVGKRRHSVGFILALFNSIPPTQNSLYLSYAAKIKCNFPLKVSVSETHPSHSHTRWPLPVWPDWGIFERCCWHKFWSNKISRLFGLIWKMYLFKLNYYTRGVIFAFDLVSHIILDVNYGWIFRLLMCFTFGEIWATFHSK